MTPARLRPLAERDLVERTGYYRSEGGDDVAVRFFEAAIDALRSIERMPGIGSLHLGELCDVPGLRFRRVDDFPCGWCYFVGEHHLDVVRLLADAQDLPALMSEVE